MLDAIIFDIGNVLLRFDFGLAVARIAPWCTVSPTAIPALLEPLKTDLETGRVTGETFLDVASEAIGYSGDRQVFRQAWQEIFAPIEPMHSLAQRLSKWKPLFLLSNTNDLHSDYFEARYPVFALFTDGIYSHRAGLMKPDPAIYTHALERFKLRPERVLFIDDLQPNVESARAAGWHVHHYAEARHHALLTQLAELGVPDSVRGA